MQAFQSFIEAGGTGGSPVANLYAALQFLIENEVFASFALPELAELKDQLRSEAPSGRFKGAAVTLVVQFKLHPGLGDGGIVDERTANALNALLKKFGAFGASTDFVVRGTVKDTHKRPKGGLVVIDFDRDLRRWQELGRAETDPEGKFEIPNRYESFRKAEGVVQPEVDLVLQVPRRQANDELEPRHP